MIPPIITLCYTLVVEVMDLDEESLASPKRLKMF